MNGRVFAVLALAIGVAWVYVGNAQKSQATEYAYAEREGAWTVSVGDQPMAAIRLTAAERAAVIRKRDAIFDTLKSSQVLNPLKGIVVRANKTISARADNEGRMPVEDPVMSLVGATIGKFVLIQRTQEVQPFTTEMPRLEILTNDLDTLVATWKWNRFFYETVRDEMGRVVFLEPRVSVKTADGRPVYALDDYHEVVALTNGRPLWVALTCEQFLRAMMNYQRERMTKDAGQRTTWSAPRAEGDSFEAQMIRGFEKELAALSPAERQRPAYYARPGEDRLMASGLTPADAPGARPVVMMNPDYFDRSLPRTAVQLIACHYNYNHPFDSARPDGTEGDIARSALHRLVKQLEYGRLQALVER